MQIGSARLQLKMHRKIINLERNHIRRGPRLRIGVSKDHSHRLADKTHPILGQQKAICVGRQLTILVFHQTGLHLAREPRLIQNGRSEYEPNPIGRLRLLRVQRCDDPMGVAGAQHIAM